VVDKCGVLVFGRCNAAHGAVVTCFHQMCLPNAALAIVVLIPTAQNPLQRLFSRLGVATAGSRPTARDTHGIKLKPACHQVGRFIL
jgi:hypothetical protein